MFSRTLRETANKPTLFLYDVQLLYFHHAKFLGITFDHKFTFKKHFEDNFGVLPTKISSHKNVGQSKVGTKPTNNFADL